MLKMWWTGQEEQEYELVEQVPGYASGSCPMKFDRVAVNILYVFSRSYWSFSL